MDTTVITLDVDRPAEDVFQYVADPARFAEWQKDVESVEMESADPLKVGARYRTTRTIGPLKLRTNAMSEVVESDPPRRWVARILDGPVRSIVTVGVEPLDGDARSRVTIEIDYTGHGIGKVLIPLIIRRQFAKQAPINRRALQERLER